MSVHKESAFREADFQARYLLPPVATDHRGKERRVGVEIEFSGPEITALVEVTKAVFPGEVERLSDYEYRIHNPEFGTFVVEVDFALLKRVAREKEESGNVLDELYSRSLGSITRGWVPCEIITPPIPVSRLGSVDRLIAAVREKGAKGTHDSIWNAFGLHFNPDVPSARTDSLRKHLQAYICLHDWLVEHGEVDFSRRVTPYINPFEEDYIEHILQREYRPDRPQFIDDYLRFNPTRNRALDMLPLIMFLDEKRLRSVVLDPLVKPRPTFHYRLPNCDIDNPQWGLWQAWNDWVEVERLAADRGKLNACCAAYLEHLDSLTPDFIKPWREQVTKWLSDDARMA